MVPSKTPHSETDDGASSSRSGTTQGSGSQQASKLLRCSAAGDLEQVLWLLDTASAGVNTLRARGSTALHEASKAGHLAVVAELVRRAAEVNALNRSGCTALHFATLCKDRSRSLGIVELLLDARCGVNATSERIDTPLHFATYCQATLCSREVLRCLLGRRATVNSRNRNSETPLYNAALHGNTPAVEVLLEHSADITQRNSLEKSPLDIARESGHEEVARLLQVSKDPMAQLAQITGQMQTALNQMQAVDSLSIELRHQSALTEAFQGLAVAAVGELDAKARSRMAEQALNMLREYESPAASTAPPSQHQVFQALVTLLLISRVSRGNILLHEMGAFEVLPFVEQCVTKFGIGHKELRELRMELNKTQVELLEFSTREPSRSNTPSSSKPGETTHSLATSIPVRSERQTMSSTTSESEVIQNLQQRRPSSRSLRSSGWRVHEPMLDEIRAKTPSLPSGEEAPAAAESPRPRQSRPPPKGRLQKGCSCPATVRCAQAAENSDRQGCTPTVFVVPQEDLEAEATEREKAEAGVSPVASGKRRCKRPTGLRMPNSVPRAVERCLVS
mmetsp:Transcript_21400/g.61936  ORF Transcript_21400/g.61936 Transcript_21400/m.61936 type:complete len:565 (+) Transcript_21400:100-1794(+)